jgi:ankyrin repeat protein
MVGADGQGGGMLERIADGRTDLVLPWVESGEDPRAAAQGASLIGWCAYYGDVSGVEYLRGHGVALGELGGDLGLNGAAFHGHWRLVQYLVEHGADPNGALDDTGETPLHSALCKLESLAHDRVVEVLLAAGARVDAVTKVGVETGCFMRDIRTRGETALHRAGAYGSVAVIEMLLAAGADREARDANGDSPLTWASWALRGPEILRPLCHGEHRVREGYAGMAANLLGKVR